MMRTPTRTKLICVLVLGQLAGCGGNKMLKEPQSMELQGPLVVAADSRLSAALDWVIVRDGPGTWSKNAHWDEYLLRLQNLSDNEITIDSVVVFDSMETRVGSSINRKQLAKDSRSAAKRYNDEGFKVQPGLGGGQLAAIGGATAAVGTGVVLTSSSLGYAAGAGAVGAVVVAPVLLVGGVVRGVNNSKVSKEIANRSSNLPLVLNADAAAALDVFFPMSPSPVRIEVSYSVTDADYILTIDTEDTLRGLHLSAPEREMITD